MSLDVLRGMDMFFIIGMEEFFHALSEMFPMGPPTLIQTLDHAKWEGFHFYDIIFPLFAFIIGACLSIAARASGRMPAPPAVTAAAPGSFIDSGGSLLQPAHRHVVDTTTARIGFIAGRVSQLTGWA